MFRKIALTVNFTASCQRRRPLNDDGISILHNHGIRGRPEGQRLTTANDAFPIWVLYSRRGPLSDDQFAAALFLERHSLIQRYDRALSLFIGGGLGGDSLQPEAGSGHQREQ